MFLWFFFSKEKKENIGKVRMLIGVIGKKNSGKDTLGDFLHHQYGFIKRAFADPIKECCQLLFQFSDDQLHDPLLKETIDPRWNQTPRQIMQRVGTDLFRNHFQQDFWLTLFEQWYANNPQKNVVCTDVRFENEALLIKRLGGILILVERNHPPETSIDLHESEHMTFQTVEPDYIIQNHGSSFTEYYERIQSIYQSL